MKGVDLPLGENNADYIDYCGHMQLIPRPHEIFPNLLILVQCTWSYCMAKVGCECFFNLSGCVSLPHRTVSYYEQLAILASLLRVIYIEPEWVA